MNKLEYLNQLENILKKNHMAKADIDDIIRDYAEFFEEGRRQGQNDAEISAKLGNPELVAQQILEENQQSASAAPVTAKSEFKLPEIKLPKFERKEKEAKEKTKQQANSGCLSSMLLGAVKLAVFCIVVPCLAILFGCAALALGAAFVGLICLFLVVILGFFGASLAAHFLTFPVTLFAITACIALLSLIICIGALLAMLLVWCGKLFISLLRVLMGWPIREHITENCELPDKQDESMEKEDGELYE